MRYVKYINQFIFSVLAMVIPIAGCNTDTLHDYNIHPQALNQVNMNFLFSAAQLGAASGGSAGDNRYIDWRTNIGYCSYFVQHLAHAGTGGLGAGDKYFDNVESFHAPWEFIYGDQLKNLNEVLKQTGPGGFEEGNRKNTREASRILRAFLFHRLTDYYGHIPYSEALRGIEGLFQPKYDHQQDIYADLLKELDEAAAAISASNPDDGFAAADIIYDGDVNKWKKWAYSLMLRLAMRVSNVNGALATTYVNKAMAGSGGVSVFSSNDDNAVVPMAEAPGLWVNQNGISRAFISGDGGQTTIMGKTLIDMLKGADPDDASDDDPRLLILSGGVDGDTDPLVQRGMPNGLDAATLDTYLGVIGANANLFFSRINTLLLDRDEPYMLMHHAEVEFLMAEASERGIGTIPGTPESHYNAGVKSALQMYTLYDESFDVSDAEVNAYLANYPYGGATNEKLEMIGNQMWISKFFNWWDAWADWRRTGFPALVPVNYPGNLTNGQIPRRLRLPVHEVAVNETNLNNGATKPLDDVVAGRVWWDGGN